MLRCMYDGMTWAVIITGITFRLHLSFRRLKYSDAGMNGVTPPREHARFTRGYEYSDSVCFTRCTVYYLLHILRDAMPL